MMITLEMLVLHLGQKQEAIVKIIPKLRPTGTQDVAQMMLRRSRNENLFQLLLLIQRATTLQQLHHVEITVITMITLEYGKKTGLAMK